MRNPSKVDGCVFFFCKERSAREPQSRGWGELSARGNSASRRFCLRESRILFSLAMMQMRRVGKPKTDARHCPMKNKKKKKGGYDLQTHLHTV
jgi:hypothetical protein